MPFLSFEPGKPFIATEHLWEGVYYAEDCVEFTALALEAQKLGLGTSRLHLYALAIELGLKSLALRAGATPQKCKNAGHQITKMFALVEQLGSPVSARLLRRLNNDHWFSKMVTIRYATPKALENPTLEDAVCFHSDYPEMIAEILETPCAAPLSFEGGSALFEITTLLEKQRAAAVRKNSKAVGRLG